MKNICKICGKSGDRVCQNAHDALEWCGIDVFNPPSKDKKL